MNTQPYKNPLIEQRADPWVYKHEDGYYYFTASVPEYDRIELRRAKTINGLREADPIVAWRKHDTGVMSANIWAPEIHYIDGKWYIYFASARTTETKEGLFDHRMFALENEAENPLEGEWVEKGQVKTKWESFALDATSFEHKGVRYYVWAQKDPEIEGNSNLYISEMENPWTLKGKQVMIATPEYEWEKIGFFVNEGAAVLKRNGKIFMTFSGSATDYNYCMGLLVADEESDLLDPQSWYKLPEPVFKTNEETGQYGPGHNSFTTTEDGNNDVLIYHARNYKDIEGDPLYDPNRHTRAQVFNYDKNGFPQFNVPIRDER
ncbi:glycoside hydrolase family 43 protein [Alkalihalobacillus hemicellulosilyticus]|uniref:Alpha-L-arabinofuranosidase II n=1 Tax=Halalkalibacter hemicellulosilyticusJCM 9152 TaxID=1236971 RepID=W4QJH6_9BACI|nr:family 43 glycosylhydrolase [Halalkalibacter hemicellulosilyticus]GAE32275.1 alpha-L-arabinofuranosidase II precursor [Halalkalibacter hemicellulosilyticusJCM 9152]